MRISNNPGLQASPALSHSENYELPAYTHRLSLPTASRQRRNANLNTGHISSFAANSTIFTRISDNTKNGRCIVFFLRCLPSRITAALRGSSNALKAKPLFAGNTVIAYYPAPTMKRKGEENRVEATSLPLRLFARNIQVYILLAGRVDGPVT